MLEVELPDDVPGDDLSAQFSRAWREDPAATRRRGDAWLAARRSLLLRVPSAVVGRSFNRLFNPLHALAASCRVLSVVRYPFDERLSR